MNKSYLLVGLALVACGGGGGGTPDAGGPALRLQGDAVGGDQPDGEWVECTFFVDLGEPLVTGDGWTTVGLGGEVFRRTWAGDAPAFEFQAIVAGEVTLVDSGGDVELRAFGDQTGAMPFWLEIEVLTGTSTGQLSYQGAWTCAPILPGSPAEDSDLEVAGTWTLM